MRTLTAAALIAVLDAAALASPDPSRSVAPPPASGAPILLAGGMGGGGMGGMGGGLRPGGGGGMGGGGMGGGGMGGGGMGGGGMGGGGGGMGGGGWTGGFGTMHPRPWAQAPAAADNPDCERPAAKSKKTKTARKARRTTPECAAGY